MFSKNFLKMYPRTEILKKLKKLTSLAEIKIKTLKVIHSSKQENFTFK